MKPRYDLAHRIQALTKTPLAETYGRGAEKYPDGEWPPVRDDIEDLAHAAYHLDKLLKRNPRADQIIARLHLENGDKDENEDHLSHLVARGLLPLARRAV